MKVSELTGAQLDYWVARAEIDAGILTIDPNDHSVPYIKFESAKSFENGVSVFCSYETGLTELGKKQAIERGKKPEIYRRWPSVGNFRPSTDWAWGGPIIERERIGQIPLNAKITGDANGWVAVAYSAPDADGYSDDEFNYSGPTPLIAAMRAYVASKFGDKVPDEVRP